MTTESSSAFPRESDAEPRASEVVRLEGLVKKYGDLTAVAGIDLSIYAGEIFGFLGPNGAGKTTTIESIVGLRKPTGGSITVFGLDPFTERAATTARVALQPQSASLFESLTVIEALRLFASFHENPLDVLDTLELIGLTKQRGLRAKKLSGGQARRLLIGVALIGNPDLIVLDEPSAGLDPAARHSLWSVIRQMRARGTTVLLSTHLMEEAAEVCDRIVILVDGGIAALGAPDELIRAQSSRAEVSFTLPRDADLSDLGTTLGGVEPQWREETRGIRVTVATNDPDEVIRKLTFAQSLHGREISVRRSSLEDLFIKIAQQDGDDEGDEPPRKRKSRRRTQ